MINPQTGTNRYDSQKGMTGMGSPRWNIYKAIQKDTGPVKGYVEIDRKGTEILRVQCGTNKYASQKDITAIGANRPNIGIIAYREDMKPGHDKDTETIVSQQAGDYQRATQSTEEVGLGKRRNQVGIIRGRMPRDPKSHEILPFQSGTNIYASQIGMGCPPGLGGFRQATQQLTNHEVEGLNFTEEQLRKGADKTPWYAGTNKFDSQKLTGGFSKYRDVLNHVKGEGTIGKIPEERELETHGIVRLQSGTNKLASQKLMTGFGTPRNTMMRMKWKQEWVEDWDEAYKEWKASGRGRSDDESSSTRSTKQIVEVEEKAPEPEPEEEEEEEEEE